MGETVTIPVDLAEDCYYLLQGFIELFGIERLDPASYLAATDAMEPLINGLCEGIDLAPDARDDDETLSAYVNALAVRVADTLNDLIEEVRQDA